MLTCDRERSGPLAAIYTTGYEGESIDEFVEKLLNVQVDILVDVRKLPLSRKKGFSKTPLRTALSTKGIDYHHYPELGMPDHLRKLRHDLDDNGPILDAYDSLLPQHETTVAALAELATQKTVCLMCFEADATQCHRSRLADYLSQRHDGFAPKHVA